MRTGSSLSVEFRAERWVIPDVGDLTIVFRADAADDSWEVGDTGLLVLHDGSPPLLLDSEAADEVEASWDGVNTPTGDNCDA